MEPLPRVAVGGVEHARLSFVEIDLVHDRVPALDVLDTVAAGNLLVELASPEAERPGRLVAQGTGYADRKASRMASTRLRLTPRSEYPRREAERTWITLPSPKSSTSSTNPMSGVENSA